MKFALLTFCLLSVASLFAQKYSVTVNATGFPDNVGQAYLGIYRAQDDFPVINKQYVGKVVAISGNKASLMFTLLPKGNYAVAVFHDRNKNGKLDTNLFGVPTEEYGFSNNARNTFSAPSFKDASFTVDGNKTISITIK
jgi:uncharacterized protein (DUF2141 family)